MDMYNSGKEGLEAALREKIGSQALASAVRDFAGSKDVKEFMEDLAGKKLDEIVRKGQYAKFHELLVKMAKIYSEEK
jgi:hypothetical protein